MKVFRHIIGDVVGCGFLEGEFKWKKERPVAVRQATDFLTPVLSVFIITPRFQVRAGSGTRKLEGSEC